MTSQKSPVNLDIFQTLIFLQFPSIVTIQQVSGQLIGAIITLRMDLPLYIILLVGIQ